MFARTPPPSVVCDDQWLGSLHQPHVPCATPSRLPETGAPVSRTVIEIQKPKTSGRGRSRLTSEPDAGDKASPSADTSTNSLEESIRFP
jgi:hypothetical protein